MITQNKNGVIMSNKKCNKCNVTKSVDQFYWRKDSQKYRANCKACVASQNAKREKHWLEVALVHSKLRAKKHEAHYENFNRHELKEYWDSNGIDIDTCYYCKGESGSIDHYVSFQKGGEHVMSNCRPSCKRCNSMKFTKDPEVFQQIVDSGFTIKWCSRCESTKELSEFHKDSARSDGKYNYCKPCQSKIATSGRGPHWDREYTCPHCNLTGKGNIMLGRHFDNCKHRRDSL